jgi:hypothetical protein
LAERLGPNELHDTLVERCSENFAVSRPVFVVCGGDARAVDFK